jgi:hypothetical protein
MSTAIQQVGQVAPVRIIFFDLPRLPVAVPILQLLFACDCFLRRRERLHMDKAVHTIFLDEFQAATAAVLLKPGPHVVGNADIESPVFPAGENVDVIRCCAHGFA